MSTLGPPPGGDNPYDAPVSPHQFSDRPEGSTSHAITAKTVEMMRQTRPWALFVGITSVAFGVLMLLMAAAALAMMERAPNRQELTAGSVVYIVSGIVQIITGVMAVRFGTRAGSFVRTREVPRLDAALEAQRSFWRVVGVMAAIVLGLLLLLFMLMAVRAAASVEF